MLSLHTSATVCGSIFALVVVIGAAGNLVPAHVAARFPWLLSLAKVLFIALFVALPFAFVPFMVNLVAGRSTGVPGTGRLAVVWTLWTLMAAGAVVAALAALRFGAFRFA